MPSAPSAGSDTNSAKLGSQGRCSTGVVHPDSSALQRVQEREVEHITSVQRLSLTITEHVYLN